MTESVPAPGKSGLRRRGHLLRGLRFLVTDPKATPKQRLEACKMLFALETAPDRDKEESELSPENSSQIAALIAKMEEDRAV